MQTGQNDHFATRTHFLWDRWFEAYEAVPTSGFLDADDLNPVDMTNHTSLINYVPTPMLVVSWLLDGLDIDCKTYSFVDVGSGRGRVLLAAAEKPFKRVEGVEFSKVLHREAQENIKMYPRTKLVCQDIHSICQDAAKYQLPAGDCVVFMFNPFEPDLLNRVLKSMLDQAQASGSKLKIIYFNPAYADEMTGHKRLKEVKLNFATGLKMHLASPYAARVYKN